MGTFLAAVIAIGLVLSVVGGSGKGRRRKSGKKRSATPREPYAELYRDGNWTELTAADVTAMLKPWRERKNEMARMARRAASIEDDLRDGKIGRQAALVALAPMVKAAEDLSDDAMALQDELHFNTDAGYDKLQSLIDDIEDACMDVESAFDAVESATPEDDDILP
ncbi:hypothetical protein [Oricola thermophila]|uniref:Uncharacterized protein n=1 Tax=Oricola thermophila TaxID=2742145 RepID=A0A6N1VCU9_9HYPH|nr:hypothetical protein [Oricola thermophila]QKV18730.1 hypothetical protein HTY61_09845 [Oricola thermophila]